MPFDPRLIDSRLINAARERSLIPFVGAGVSKQTGADFPSWRELLSQMKEEALKLAALSGRDAKEIDELVARGQFLIRASLLENQQNIEMVT